MTHTPEYMGPFEYEQQYRGQRYRVFYPCPEGRGLTIVRNIVGEETARLFAAAPDTNEALRNAINRFETIQETHPDIALDADLKLYRTAYIKAIGGNIDEIYCPDCGRSIRCYECATQGGWISKAGQDELDRDEASADRCIAQARGQA